MEMLRFGMRSPQVQLLQRLLNKRRAHPRVAEDGVFGSDTRAAVIDFQQRVRLDADGVVGGRTWSRLGLVIDIQHPVALFPQPTGMTCWSAAATMVLGDQSVGPGRAALTASGGLEPSPENVQRFADGLGWQMHHPQSWTVDGLAALVRQSPLWVVGGGGSGRNAWLHAVVISALWSDGAQDASGTMVRIHDPWPPNVGSVYARFYRGTVDGFDFLTRYVLHPIAGR